MRQVKLTPLCTNMFLYGDAVPYPPRDGSWVDRQMIHDAQHGYPQTSLNAQPDYVPASATHLVSEGRMAEDEGYPARGPRNYRRRRRNPVSRRRSGGGPMLWSDGDGGGDGGSLNQDFLLMMIVFVLMLNLVVLLMLLAK